MIHPPLVFHALALLLCPVSVTQEKKFYNFGHLIDHSPEKLQFVKQSLLKFANLHLGTDLSLEKPIALYKSYTIIQIQWVLGYY